MYYTSCTNCEAWNCVSVDPRPSMTCPVVGGVLSMITPSDVTLVHSEAELHAVTVTKYRTPSTGEVPLKSSSENKDSYMDSSN